MEEQFKKLNIPIFRFAAVNGSELNPDILKKNKKKHQILAHYPFPNNGEIGICLTHFKLWEFLSKQPEDFSIVLEDDVIVSKDLFDDLEALLSEITTNDFIDLSGRKGFIGFEKNNLTIKYLIPSLSMTGQIIGKNAAKKLIKTSSEYYAPIDVMKQDVFKHKVNIYSTFKKYLIHNDQNIGGSTIQLKSLNKIKKIIREVIRPFWQLIALISYKTYRIVKNYLFYRKKTI